MNAYGLSVILELNRLAGTLVCRFKTTLLFSVLVVFKRIFNCN